jgi:pimeloyl-ACP methyl ester carboxylesterase
MTAAVNFEDVGHGPALVYLRLGNPARAPLVAALAQEFRVLTLRAGGEGDSAVAAGVLEQFARTIRALGIQRVGIIAHGEMTSLALQLAIAHPEMVEAIALMAPPVIGAGEDLGPLAEIKQPTLVLFGTRDQTSPPQAGKAYRQAIAGCHLVFVYDAARDMDSERPEAVAAILRDFMTSRERFLVSKKTGQIYP